MTLLSKFTKQFRTNEKPRELKVALFIDCDNVNSGIDRMLKICRSKGDLAMIRVYGCGASFGAKEIRTLMAKERVEFIPTINQSRNATDMELIMDTTNLMTERTDIEVYAIATCDEDFAPLVGRLKDAGKTVLGFGHTVTSLALKKACSEYHVVKPVAEESEPPKSPVPVAPPVKLPEKRATRYMRTLNSGYRHSDKIDGWAFIPDVAQKAATYATNNGLTIAEFEELSYQKIADDLVASKYYSSFNATLDIDGFQQQVLLIKRKGAKSNLEKPARKTIIAIETKIRSILSGI